MKFLFVHQNMPGQFREMAWWLSAQGHQVAFLTQSKKPPGFDRIRVVRYKPHHKPSEKTYGLSRTWETAAGNGFGAAMALRRIVASGFVPDVVMGHIGWGEMSFFREVLPDVPMVGLFEYYFSCDGGPVGFDPGNPINEHAPFIMRSHNVVPHLNIEVVDVGYSPTFWQRDRFPKSFHDKLYVCHDGIRTDRLRPDEKAKITLGRMKRPLTAEDEILTYMARNLETTRGFHQFMRALPRIQKERPNVRTLVIGGDDTSYSIKNTHAGGLRGEMEEEVGHLLDWDRLHFLGRVSYRDYCNIVRISGCHVYLTMPFVLSWSLLESMSMQATIVASDVSSVREVIEHGKTGLLVDFFDHEALAAQIVDVLERPGDYAHLGPAARERVVGAHDFLTVCMPEHLRRINELMPGNRQISMP